MHSEPLLTIAVICNEEEKYIDRCMKSIMSQTYKKIEIVFIDNCSNDMSYEKAVSYNKEFASMGISINIFRGKRKVSRERCILLSDSKAEGDMIYYITPRITLHNTFAWRIVQEYSKNRDVGAIVVSQQRVAEDLEIIDEHRLLEDGIVDERRFFDDLIVFDAFWIGQIAKCTMYRYIVSKYRYTFENFQHVYDLFTLFCWSKIIYISDFLVREYVEQDEVRPEEKNMLVVFEGYNMLLAYRNKATILGRKFILSEYDNMVKKIAWSCMAEALRVYSFGKKELALKYIAMATVFWVDIDKTEKYTEIKEYIMDGKISKDYRTWCKKYGRALKV